MSKNWADIWSGINYIVACRSERRCGEILREFVLAREEDNTKPSAAGAEGLEN
jgi:hypothetical protein